MAFLMNNTFLIITASYNRPELLMRNIEALQQQTYSHWLQIIVDDGSIEDMQHVFAIAKTDTRITVIQAETNQGCNATRNCALDYIKQQQLRGFISFVDDDDFLLLDALENINHLIHQTPNYQWYTADCCFESGEKASRLAKHGKLSYLQNYMFGKEIKGDLNHFIASEACTNIRFATQFRNGQEWSFYSQLSAQYDFFAFDFNCKVVEYLEGGLTQKKVNSQEKLAVFQYKVDVLQPLVSARQLSGQQLLLARELINNKQYQEALRVLKKIFRFKCFSVKFYRYFLKASFK
jgi:glycosyltransferase involved in cell wall biosynthesis